MNWFNLANALALKLTWFGCVLGGVTGGAAPLAGLVGLSWWRGTLRDDLSLLPALALVGFGLDTLWDLFGILDYADTDIAPPWIVMLWIAVGLTFNHSLAVFKARPLLGGVLAGSLAPVSYLIGARFGAVLVPEPVWLVPVASSWMLIFYVVFTCLGASHRREAREEYR